jgi:hypothetical protein
MVVRQCPSCDFVAALTFTGVNGTLWDLQGSAETSSELWPGAWWRLACSPRQVRPPAVWPFWTNFPQMQRPFLPCRH